MRRKTTEQFITEAKAIHGDKYDYLKVEYISDNDDVCIICPIHGEFWQKAGVHLRKSGCPLCALERVRLGYDNFVAKASKKHNNKYDYSKVVYERGDKRVCIICPKHGEFWQTPYNHASGQECPKCSWEKRRKGVLNIGINSGDRRKHKEAYSHWHGMISRCYGTIELEKRPTYTDCSVCEEWLDFPNFIDWFYQHHKEGWHLDKDILVKGNKVYSPDTCCFVPSEINGLFAKCNAIRGKYPIGIQFFRGVYIAGMRKDMKRVYLGRSKDLQTAFNIYKQAKEDWIKVKADKWKDQLEPRVYEALYNYKVEITD